MKIWSLQFNFESSQIYKYQTVNEWDMDTNQSWRSGSWFILKKKKKDKQKNENDPSKSDYLSSSFSLFLSVNVNFDWSK